MEFDWRYAERLFQRLDTPGYGCCQSWLEEKLRSHPSGPEAAKIKKQIASLKEELTRPALIESANEQFLQEIVDDPIVFGDESSREKVLGVAWCTEDQPVVIRGEPEFWVR